MEEKLPKIEKPSELVTHVAEVIFSNNVEYLPSYDPDIPAPYCEEESLVSILKALKAYSGIKKIGAQMEFKDEITAEKQEEFYRDESYASLEDQKRNFNYFRSDNMWHNPSGGGIILEDNPPAIFEREKNEEKIISFIINTPVTFYRRLQFANQTLLLTMRKFITEGKNKEFVAEYGREKGFSKYYPIDFKGNCIGVLVEVDDDKNPCKNPMAALILGLNLKESLRDDEKFHKFIESAENSI